MLTVALLAWPITGALPATESEQRTSRTIRVGQDYPVKTIAAAARLAQDGDIIEITAGDYVGDTAVWTQTDLKIRGINGRPRLIAEGKAAEEKGIWVIRGGDILVENIEFTGARVANRNGAGIRFERGKLKVRKCVFKDNENGMLVGNDPSMILEIEDSEFGDNGAWGRAEPQSLRRNNRALCCTRKLLPSCPCRASSKDARPGKLHLL